MLLSCRKGRVGEHRGGWVGGWWWPHAGAVVRNLPRINGNNGGGKRGGGGGWGRGGKEGVAAEKIILHIASNPMIQRYKALSWY